ncbi:hypothetical protein T265_16349, partial [Opisthorchis viverrini]
WKHKFGLRGYQTGTTSVPDHPHSELFQICPARNLLVLLWSLKIVFTFWVARQSNQ